MRIRAEYADGYWIRLTIACLRFFMDRGRFITLILPMGIGSAAGAVVGGLLVGIAPAFTLKIALASVLILAIMESAEETLGAFSFIDRGVPLV